MAFLLCQLPSSPSAKWNVKPHLWLALSPVMQGKQKAKWLFIVLGIPIPPNPPSRSFFFPLTKKAAVCVRPSSRESPHTAHTHARACMRGCRTAGVCMRTRAHIHSGRNMCERGQTHRYTPWLSLTWQTAVCVETSQPLLLSD